MKCTHAGATEVGSCRPGANMAVTVVVNAGPVERISYQLKTDPLDMLATVRPRRSYR
jgi:hypothetical protein